MSAPTAARLAAFETVRRVFEEGAWADRAFRSAAERHRLVGRERAQGQSLAYGSVQRRGSSDHLIEQLAGRPVAKLDPPLLAALRLGVYELLFASGTADHAAVDQAVELAKGRGGRRRGIGLVNAVLRRVVRERTRLLAGLDDSTPAGAAIAHSVPLWLAQLWWGQLGGERARSLLATVNLPAERAYRVNALRADRDTALERLRAEGVEAREAPPHRPPAPAVSLLVDGGDQEQVAAALEQGLIVPQARSSAAVVELLAPQPGERILDLCAGPGIKTTQIAAALAGRGQLVSVERDPGRASELRELCTRLGAERVRVELGDAAGPPPAFGFDAVLVDPPCSGLGTLASRPDLRWRRDPAQIEPLAELQARILARAHEAVRAGGRIIYSTCTISAAENQAVAASAAGSTDDLAALEPELALAGDRRFLQTLPDRDGTDGFFVACFRA